MYAVEEYSLNGKNEFIGATYFTNCSDALELCSKIDKDFILIYVVRIFHNELGEVRTRVIISSEDMEG